MILKIELTNELENLRIFHDITLEGFKHLLKTNPELLLNVIEELEYKLTPLPISSVIEHTPFVYCGSVE